MKKRVISFIFAVFMLISLLPSTVLAASNIVYPNTPNPYSATFTDNKGISYNTAASGKNKILVFGRTDCTNTAAVISGLRSGNVCDYADVYVLRIDTQGTTLSEFLAYGNCPGAKYFDYQSGISNLLWNYCGAYVGSDSLTLPLVVVLNSSNTVVMVSTEVSGVVNAIKKVVGVPDSNPDPGPSHTDVKIPSFPEYNEEEWEVLRLSNKLRTSLGLRPLTMAPLIQKAADIRVNEVAYLYSHTRPSGESCITVLDDLGDRYNMAGENISAGYPTPLDAYTGWFNSPGHYENMTKANFIHYGGGFTPKGDGYNTSWVQLFSYSAYCSYTNATIFAPKTTLNLGDSIDSLGATLIMNCSQHGTCCMPIIDEICTGFNSNTVGTQTVMVSACGKTASFRVTVVDSTVHVTGVSVAPETLSLKSGSTYTLAASVKPDNATNKNVIWASNNVNVATVDSFGLVTAKQPGTAVITAISQNGDKTAACIVTVSAPEYSLNFYTNGGTTIMPVSMPAGSTISLNDFIPTKKNCIFTGWYADSSLKKQITAVTITQNTIIYAGWKDESAQSAFIDVHADDWYYQSVAWAVSRNITQGTTKNTFSPTSLCTRAQCMTFLWRAAGEPSPKSYSNPFVDVKPSDYYYKAVLWALENGITTGTDKTHFSPNAVCTRAQCLTFIWRSAGQPAVTGITTSFTDVSRSDFYYNAVLWAVKNNITTGISSSVFSPNGACNRAQIVTFLYRWQVR